MYLQENVCVHSYQYFDNNKDSQEIPKPNLCMSKYIHALQFWENLVLANVEVRNGYVLPQRHRFVAPSQHFRSKVVAVSKQLRSSVVDKVQQFRSSVVAAQQQSRSSVEAKPQQRRRSSIAVEVSHLCRRIAVASSCLITSTIYRLLKISNVGMSIENSKNRIFVVYVHKFSIDTILLSIT